MKFNWGQFKYLATAAGIGLLLAGCGGGGDSPTATTTVSGVAMAGPFLSGNVCAYRIANGDQGSQLGCSPIDAATSGYTITFSGYTGDVLVAMEGAPKYDDEATSGDETTGTPLVGTLRSIVNVSAAGATVNVALTPLTEAAIRAANTLSRTDIETAGRQLAQTFGLTASGFDLFATLPRLEPTSGDHAAYRQALRALSQMQSGGGYQGRLGDYLTYFAANASTLQTAVQAAIQTNLAANCSYANNAISCTITTPGTGGGTGGGGGSGTGGGSGSGTGNYTLTVSVTAPGITIPAITISNVPKPATKTEFCGDASVTSALNSAASGGTLTIDSCTFDGTSGSISATVSITTPVSATIPYTVNYSYAANGGGTTGGGSGGSGTGATSGGVTAAFPTNLAGHFLLSYSSGPNIGIDLRTPGTQALRVTLDSAGGLSGYDTEPGCTPAANCENVLIGTNSVAELGGNANITWGRWNGGTTAGSYYNHTYTFSNTQGFHYVLGVKGAALAALPTTGTVTYALSGATQPTVGSGGVGTFTGSVKVDYATNKVGVDFTVTMSDRTYRIVSNGGLTTLTNSELSLDRTSALTPPAITGFIPMPQGGTACPNASGCKAIFDGMVVSAAASGAYQVGGTYMIFTSSPGAGSVHGAAVFQ